MNAEQIARVAHEVNRAYCQALGDNSQPAWEDALPAAQQAKDYIFRGVVLALAHAPVMAAEPSAEQKP